jgi:uncharacterized protein (UPF0276 family)
VIGLSYFSGVEPLLRAAPELVDVLEIEPQTFWLQPDPRRAEYRVDAAALERIRCLPFPKLLHGIGFPVGGTEPPPESALAPFLATRDALAPLHASEHLSFNRARGAAGAFCAGFLLPPRQTLAGADAAVRSIRVMAEKLGTPIAVETGVNYLRPRRDELPDGAFFAEVVERADAGILLDLHNLLCNERNGRETIDAFLRRIPLERVWEVHLAGGSESGAYWIDSHSGAIPDPLFEIAARVVPRLPQLRAVVFELFPEYLPRFGLDGVRTELERMRERLELRRAPAPPRESLPLEVSAGPAPVEWEDALGALVAGQPAGGELARELATDPAIALLRGLVDEFRASMLAATLKLTLRLLLLTLGRERVDALLARYFERAAPQLFASTEAEGFAAFLDTQHLAVPHLDDVLGYERALLDTLLHGCTRVVPFHFDPVAVLRALGEARLPLAPRRGSYELEITPDA